MASTPTADHHAAVLDHLGRQLGDREFPTTPSGYRRAAGLASLSRPTLASTCRGDRQIRRWSRNSTRTARLRDALAGQFPAASTRPRRCPATDRWTCSATYWSGAPGPGRSCPSSQPRRGAARAGAPTRTVRPVDPHPARTRGRRGGPSALPTASPTPSARAAAAAAAPMGVDLVVGGPFHPDGEDDDFPDVGVKV